MYPIDKEASFEMLNYLHGPRGLSVSDKQFIQDRFRDKDYVPRSYFVGATPDNNYEPSEPYTIKFFENPYARQNIDEGYLTLQVESGGADSPRQIRLRTKPSTGQWFLWEGYPRNGTQRNNNNRTACNVYGRRPYGRKLLCSM